MLTRDIVKKRFIFTGLYLGLNIVLFNLTFEGLLDSSVSEVFALVISLIYSLTSFKFIFNNIDRKLDDVESLVYYIGLVPFVNLLITPLLLAAYCFHLFDLTNRFIKNNF